MKITREMIQEIGKAGFVSIDEQLELKRVWQQVHFPRSKRKRIRRKWAKMPRNYGWRYSQKPAYTWRQPEQPDGPRVVVMNRPFYVLWVAATRSEFQPLKLPAENYQSFVLMWSALAIKSLGVPQSVLLADSNSSNYSAARLDYERQVAQIASFRDRLGFTKRG